MILLIMGFVFNIGMITFFNNKNNVFRNVQNVLRIYVYLFLKSFYLVKTYLARQIMVIQHNIPSRNNVFIVLLSEHNVSALSLMKMDTTWRR